MKHLKKFNESDSENLFSEMVSGSYFKNGVDYPDAKFCYDKNGKFLFAYEDDKWCRVSYTNLCEPFYKEYGKEYLNFLKAMIEGYFKIKIAQPSWKSGSN